MSNAPISLGHNITSVTFLSVRLKPVYMSPFGRTKLRTNTYDHYVWQFIIKIGTTKNKKDLEEETSLKLFFKKNFVNMLRSEHMILRLKLHISCHYTIVSQLAPLHFTMTQNCWQMSNTKNMNSSANYHRTQLLCNHAC